MTAAASSTRGLAKAWMKIGANMLPFADAATEELPLAKLLRLSLFQVSVGMAIALLIGTLNRVMIVELGVPVWLVATMVSLPLVFAPFRALIGFKSDTHRSHLGWKRVPYLWFGTLLQFGGLSIMPFALILLSGDSHAPAWVGQSAAALAFLLMGAGLHTVQTAGPRARHRPRAPARAPQGRRAALRDDDARHDGFRADLRPRAGPFHRGAADPGGAGHGRRHDDPQPFRAVEAGAAQSRRHVAQREAAELRAILGVVRRAGPADAPARRGRARHDGVLDAGRAARALRRAGAAPLRRRDDGPHRNDGTRRSRRLHRRRPQAGPAAPTPIASPRPAPSSASPPSPRSSSRSRSARRRCLRWASR